MVGFISAADVHRIKPRLVQNACRQVAPLPDLTVDGDLTVTGDRKAAETLLDVLEVV